MPREGSLYKAKDSVGPSCDHFEMAALSHISRHYNAKVAVAIKRLYGNVVNFVVIESACVNCENGI